MKSNKNYLDLTLSFPFWLLVASLLNTSCFNKPLGSLCEKETDCDIGLRCFKPTGSRNGYCTVGCENTDCKEGTCTITQDGKICLQECNTSNDCSSGQECQRNQEDAKVCWLNDPNLTPIPAGIFIDHIELASDENDDGMLSPSEFAKVEIYAKNTGASAQDVWTSLISSSTAVQINDCMAHGNGDYLTYCGSSCSCDGLLAPAYYQDFDPGETKSVPILTIFFTLSPEAPLEPIEFVVAFHDSLENTWEDSFNIPVQASGSNIEIASTELESDTNGDGVLSPGESAKVKIYVENIGTSDAQDVWTSLISHSPLIQIDDCLQGSGGSYDYCDSSCSCDGLDSGLYYQDLDPGEVKDSPILTILFTLSSEAPLEPIEFVVAFHDSLENTWEDSFEISVVLP